MTSTRAKSGFSLVELMVVITIIAILAGATLAIPWSNLTTYSRASSADQIGSAVASARTLAIERGKKAGVIFMQNSQQDSATMITVIEAFPGTWYTVYGTTAAQLPRGTTVRAPDAANIGASRYQTNSGGSGAQDNSVDNGTGTAMSVKCFAIVFGEDGLLQTSGSIPKLDGNRDGATGPPNLLQPTDLINVPYAPYCAVIDTRTLQDNGALAFTNGQTSEDNFILGAGPKVKFLAFNRYSGSSLRK